MLLRWILLPFVLAIGAATVAAALLGIIVVLAYPRLPSIDVLLNYHPKIPLRIYSADGRLMAEFGEERRNFVSIQDVPELMKQAIIAAEDERFYKHPGIDYMGVLRAGYANVVSGGKSQGASTITMQVARNFFLSTEKTFARKLYESLLAFKIENNLTKDEILQLYINQIYLGQRAYGFGAAARIYFGKHLRDLNVAEIAMLAILPKSPSKVNPINNMRRAKLRQRYVLQRMLLLGFIDQEQYDQALKAPLRVKRHIDQFELRADHAAEMARRIAVEAFPETAYTAGLKVITTIVSKEQEAANRSLRQAVIDYDRRQGYRGAEARVAAEKINEADSDQLEDLLYEFIDSPGLRPALVLEATRKMVRAYVVGGEFITITGSGLKFARNMLGRKAPADKKISRGAIIRVARQDDKWSIVQWPEVEAAFVVGSPINGAVHALVGGFDFTRNKFNHVTQAWRQPGSSMKPFVYSAALERGFTPLSIFSDEPISLSAEETGDDEWEPKNYADKYDGPMTLRTALSKSKNMVSIRLIKAIDPRYAQDYIARFGFDTNKNPPFLTLALGAGSVTPWQQLTAYSVFANGGYKIKPFLVSKILGANDEVLAAATPPLAGDESLRVIDARNAWLIDSMLKDVVRRGTGIRAWHALKRRDIAGKTGTTNGNVDAWFCGYQPSLVGIAWVGFDQPRPLGEKETGGVAALPVWSSFMQEALQDVPELLRDAPQGMLEVESIDPLSNDLIYDYVYREVVPVTPEEGVVPFFLDGASPWLQEGETPFGAIRDPADTADPAAFPPSDAGQPAPVSNAQPHLVSPDRRVSMPTPGVNSPPR